eukprot:TRINITY_DN2053_c0_g1_i2.p1 TRINITY_DN2053_c0_g1~~TRINITY_DN2053_c0_g1_i2.p1  ORF type:complete len:212 (-),score=18.19 TRINITY_DN2053_c0_g1_i2:25-660(-)
MKGTTSKGTVTITFGDVAENHVGMQKIGEMSTEGFSFADLESAKSKFESLGSKCELISLNDSLPAEHSKDSDPSAAILIVRGGVDLLLGKDSKSEDLLKEQLALKWDTKSKMYGRVVNKKASIGERVKLILNHGDLYVMGDRATGNNWKLKKIPTLRHAAGAKRFLTIKKKKETAPLKGKEKKRKEDVPAVKATKKRKSVKKSIFKIDKED